MPQDAQGHALTIAGGPAARAYGRTVEALLANRRDTPTLMEAALAADAEAPMVLSLRAALAMLATSGATIPTARAFAARAVEAATGATPREGLHAAAVAAWAEGEVEQALADWEAILASYPRDVVAMRLHHFAAFWQGRPGAMAAIADALRPHWTDNVPGYSNVLACRAFAYEETGRYVEAEEAGRAAIERDPCDLWAAHAVAHVLEMQGRRGEGIAWLDGLERNWGEGNNLRHHLLWHRALFHLERGEFDRVIALYDQGFRDLSSPLTQAAPDLYIDMQNAISMLFRLERQGVNVGPRWAELADKAEARIGDTLSAFTLPHWAMALGATGRHVAARRLLDAVARAAEGDTLQARTLRRAALPACHAVLLRARGAYVPAVECLRPALPHLPELGGSHAQQAVLEELFLDCALRANLPGDVRLILERAAGRHPVPPARRIGFAAVARAVPH
ncbi:tetratricopeptide repeat protein [Muricoccus radiodurans]|uniref:tetratricopeptide repeat protein n=1 Tax=Muricoccus radiodurans TaxID=2231721 RepID=UPI003CF9AEBE